MDRPLAVRGAMLAMACVFFLSWNIALSTQRKNLSGTLLPVKKEDVILKVSCPGRIEPKHQDTIRAEVDGQKKNTLVQAGDTVKKGQKLLEISDSQIKLELTQKRTAMLNARSDMQKAKRDWQLEKSLYAQQAVPKRDVEGAQQTYERALQGYTIAEQELALSEKRSRGVNVVSTMDGVVVKNFVENDDFVSTGKELFKIAKMDEFTVKGNVDELDISQVQVGQEATIKCDAFAGTELVGKVERIAAQAGEGAFAEVEVLIDIVDTKGINLKPNLSAEASIVVGRIPDGIVIPASAVRASISGTYVLVSDWGGWLKKQPVKVAKSGSSQAIIESGLSAGQSVLVPKEE
jgi:HlyD family secretion protein